MYENFREADQSPQVTKEDLQKHLAEYVSGFKPGAFVKFKWWLNDLPKSLKYDTNEDMDLVDRVWLDWTASLSNYDPEDDDMGVAWIP